MRRSLLLSLLFVSVPATAHADVPYRASLTPLPGADFVQTVAIGDVTGDGRPDVIAGGRLASSGSQGRVWLAPSGSAPIGAVDLDAGDIEDLGVSNGAIVALSGTRLTTLRGLAPVHTFDIPGGGLSNALALGDVDGDGIDDALVDAVVPAQDIGAAFHGDGAGGYGAALPGGFEAQPCVRGPGGIQLADLNGDGRLDVGVSNFCTLTTSIGLNVGGGAFKRLTPVPGGLYALAFGDLNGDGVQDLVTSRSSSGNGSVSVSYGRGDGTFGSARVWHDRRGLFALTLADFDGDGHPDVVATEGFDAGSHYDDRGYTILHNDGHGWFDEQTELRLPGLRKNLIDLAAGDLDGDGRPDLAGVQGFEGEPKLSVVRDIRLGTTLTSLAVTPRATRGGSARVRYTISVPATLDVQLIASGKQRPTLLKRLKVRAGRGEVAFRLPRKSRTGPRHLRVAFEAAGVTVSRRPAFTLR